MAKPESTVAASIGRAIADMRAKAGMTQDDVAGKLEIGPEAVSRMERGVAMPSIARLYELAELFGCEAVDLLTVGSSHVDDQARHLKTMLEPLGTEDRELVMRLVEQLTERLQK